MLNHRRSGRTLMRQTGVSFVLVANRLIALTSLHTLFSAPVFEFVIPLHENKV